TEKSCRSSRCEADVLLGVYRCCSNKEIGAELGISENTVKTYIQQLFRKSGAHTRSQLVRMVVERDWGQQMTGEPEEPAPSPVPAAGEPAYLSVSAIGSSSLAA